MQSFITRLIGKNFATGFVLVLFSVVVLAVWAYCSIQTSAMREFPPSILKIGAALLGLQGSVSVADKVVKPKPVEES